MDLSGFTWIYLDSRRVSTSSNVWMCFSYNSIPTINRSSMYTMTLSVSRKSCPILAWKMSGVEVRPKGRDRYCHFPRIGWWCRVVLIFQTTACRRNPSRDRYMWRSGIGRRMQWTPRCWVSSKVLSLFSCLVPWSQTWHGSCNVSWESQRWVKPTLTAWLALVLLLLPTLESLTWVAS